jgi:N-acyl-D-aspartate/D-glutamate deacylase
MNLPALVDTLIQNAKIFNNGEPAIIEDIAIADGKIIARGKDLNIKNATRVIDGSGKWLMPGFFDIHTHYDLELEVAPGLPESVRHGTTSVVIANCSLGLAFGNQRSGEIDPIVDCFARVENLPKSLLRSCADSIDWDTPKAYLEHLEQLNLGPNVITMVPHSMLRIDAMGFDNSISRDPTDAELKTMESNLGNALKLGYAGFSTDALPFHYLANQPNCEKTIPTQFAKYDEIKRLTQVVRESGSLWQATPPKDSMVNTLKTFMLTSGLLHKKPLRTTVVAALDITNNWKLLRMAKLLANVLNSKLVKGDFHLQALGAPFKVWSDGPITPIAEEIPELRKLNETDLEDRAARLEILNDPEYVKTFRTMWLKGKKGWGLARLKRIINLEDYAFNRNLNDMKVEGCPIDHWVGLNMQYLLDRILAIKGGEIPSDIGEQELEIVNRDFIWISDEADFMLQIFTTFDLDLSWSTVTANRNPETTRELLMNPLLIPGFNDCGAHLTNMAFYDVNLRSLKLASSGGDKDVTYMIKRLTKDAADLFGVKAGTINEGDIADLILVDPQVLANYDGEASVIRQYRTAYGNDQLVNRSVGVVPLVMIAGNIAWENDDVSAQLGEKKMGRLLRATSA